MKTDNTWRGGVDKHLMIKANDIFDSFHLTAVSVSCISGCTRKGFLQQNVNKRDKKIIHVAIIKAALAALRHSLYTHTMANH